MLYYLTRGEKNSAECLQSLNEEAHEEQVCSASHRMDNAEVLLHAARTTRWLCCPPHLQHTQTVNVQYTHIHTNDT